MQAAARVCRHCGYDFDRRSRPLSQMTGGQLLLWIVVLGVLALMIYNGIKAANSSTVLMLWP